MELTTEQKETLRLVLTRVSRASDELMKARRNARKYNGEDAKELQTKLENLEEAIDDLMMDFDPDLD